MEQRRENKAEPSEEGEEKGGSRGLPPLYADPICSNSGTRRLCIVCQHPNHLPAVVLHTRPVTFPLRADVFVCARVQTAAATHVNMPRGAARKSRR